MNTLLNCRLWPLIAMGLLQGCGNSEPPDKDDTACRAPGGMSLTDIDSVTEWINAMKKPLTLPCFLKSLPRPMHYNATISTFSAQPSMGVNNPRIFLSLGKLIFTIVPDEETEVIVDPNTNSTITTWDADGYQLLEMSYEITTEFEVRHSIKAELKFPVTAVLSEAAPYDNMDFSATTSFCAFCHANETLLKNVDGVPVYHSEMLRSTRSEEIGLEEMENEHLNCSTRVEPHDNYRCNMLNAIYEQGELIWRSFPIDIPTF